MKSQLEQHGRLIFTRNDPYDRAARIELVLPRLIESRQYMRSIRAFEVPADSLAVWFLGQNGFFLKDHSGLLVGIDLYLSNSCAASNFTEIPFRVDRQLPIFIEPEDLDIDIFATTHSHQDHADPETIRRITKEKCRFIGPFDSTRIYRECGVSDPQIALIHPGESIALTEFATVQATFALPTDTSDLNHIGLLFEFAKGIRFYNTGDTAYTEIMKKLLPTGVDICAICINGGFHNLSTMQAAEIVKAIGPRVVVPCHYDMMIGNVGSPEMLRTALDVLGSTAKFVMLNYYEPWLYRRTSWAEESKGTKV